ncbi:MAG: hypothetical protein IPP38_10495 [Bacteroidetes bacterium]|nr:hypothetical protein [Bacteroidota bacterium]
MKPVRMTEGVYDEFFHITILDSSTYKLELDADNKILNDYSYKGTHHFGEEVRTTYFTLVVNHNDSAINVVNDDDFVFTVNSLNKMIAYYQEKMKAEPQNKDATIVEISVQDKIKERATDFLNTLGKVYINRDVKDKSSVAGLTLKFVDEQLEEISKTLNATELELQKFKEQKGTVDLSEESKAYLERVTNIDADRVKAEIELKSLDYLYSYVTGNRDVEELAPSSLGNPDPLLIDLITKLKELQSKRKVLLMEAVHNLLLLK